MSGGGQRRTIITVCNKKIIGIPREANNKHKIHKKYCSICNIYNHNPSDSIFSTELARDNGVNGTKISSRGYSIKTTNTTFDVITSVIETHSIECNPQSLFNNIKNTKK